MKKLLLAFFLLVAVAGFAQNPIQYLLVGTYTNNTKSDGIYVYRYNPNKNEATLVSSTKDVSNPSFLVVSNDQKYVYAVNEDHGDNGGSVSAFALDKTRFSAAWLRPAAFDLFAAGSSSQRPTDAAAVAGSPARSF